MFSFLIGNLIANSFHFDFAMISDKSSIIESSLSESRRSSSDQKPFLPKFAFNPIPEKDVPPNRFQENHIQTLLPEEDSWDDDTDAWPDFSRTQTLDPNKVKLVQNRKPIAQRFKFHRIEELPFPPNRFQTGLPRHLFRYDSFEDLEDVQSSNQSISRSSSSNLDQSVHKKPTIWKRITSWFTKYYF